MDVFNEGVDVPEVDTVLLLRPTESATIFLQQLGRGLRLSEGKECLTVLDFIGLARQEFRFDLLYTALLGGTRNELLKQLEQGFPVLPSGCSMQLDRQAMRIVLDNLRGQLRATRSFLRTELQRAGLASSLAEFLERSGLALEELYGPGWVALKREVGVHGPPVDPRKAAAVKRMLTLDNLEQIRFFRRYLDDPTCHSQREERMKAMLPELDDNVREELRAVLPLLEQRVDHLSYPLTEHPDVPLRIHCHHSLADILTAFAVPYKVREGVYFDKDSGCDLFFVTLKKSERDYSPSTLYRDFAISPELFHWESQSTTREDSAPGRRYQSHLGRTHALLFVREARKLENGETAPYLCLGPAWYVSHEGERPMAITWRLKYPIPIQFYRGMRLAA